jgi:phage protein D
MASSNRVDVLTATDYYAPDFRVEVDGREIHPETKGDVTEIKVTMDKENLTQVELTVNNWDDENFRFKYSDTDTFDVGKTIHVQLGYAGQFVSMLQGFITGLAPRFAESGPPTLGVSALDALVMLRDRKPGAKDQRKFEKLHDWEIVQRVASRHPKLQLDLTKKGPQYDLVVQKNQDDAVFIMDRAKRIDYDCFVSTDPVSKVNTLHFIKPPDARDSSAIKVYVFEWGKSLISFTPRLTVSRQVSKVTVRGWDPVKKEAIVYTATKDDLPPVGDPGTTGPEVAETKFGDKQDIVVDWPVRSKDEAKELAISKLRDRAYGFLTGTGRAVGLPDVRPGQNVELQGLGKRFSGRYYITKVEHTLDSTAGYMMTFDVRRPGDGGNQ